MESSYNMAVREDPEVEGRWEWRVKQKWTEETEAHGWCIRNTDAATAAVRAVRILEDGWQAVPF